MRLILTASVTVVSAEATARRDVDSFMLIRAWRVEPDGVRVRVRERVMKSCFKLLGDERVPGGTRVGFGVRACGGCAISELR